MADSITTSPSGNTSSGAPSSIDASTATAASTPVPSVPITTQPQDGPSGLSSRQVTVKTAEHPSPWAIVNDYTKTVITLASALLAVTITFSGQILSAAGAWQRLFLGIAWLCLLISIAAGVAAEAYLTTYLRNKATSDSCLAVSAVAYFSLIVAAFFFVACAFTQLVKSQVDIAAVAETATKNIATIEKLPGGKSDVMSIVLDVSNNRYTVEVLEETTKIRYEVISDAGTGQVISQKRFP